MEHVKSFCTDDHPELLEAAGGRAFQYFDRSDRMTKSASSVISKSDIQDLMPPHDHFGVHLTSMGAEEFFGYNRNGDAASSRSLELYHPTFEKFGHVFREHRNKDPRTQGVGVVKLARYNPDMHRGELVVWVSKDKAPDMYKRAKDDQELSWSMSMRLPFDRCSCCDKKSRSPSAYCDHLKANMGRYVPEFQKYAYARNEDDVKFFDISEVKRRADRIATYLGYVFNDSDMHKAASADQVINGAEWYKFFHGEPVCNAFTPWEAGTLSKLAAASAFVRHADQHTLDVLAAMTPSALSRAQAEIAAGPDFRSVAGEMAKRAMILDFASFASIITGKSVDELRKNAGFADVEDMKIPGLLECQDATGGCACGEDAAESVSPDEFGCGPADKDSIDALMDDVGDNLGMKDHPVSTRTITVTIKTASVKGGMGLVTPAFDPFYATMAEAYGCYLVKAAHIAKDVTGVSENVLFRGIAAMNMLRR